MSIRDRINFTHSALTVLDFCGDRQRGGWWMQYPGYLKVGSASEYIKRTR